MAISASLVKELRDETNLGMMECKKALLETDGDKTRAVQLLRERGIAIAGKRADRSANEGRVAANVQPGGKTATMIEVNCETDFVARNEAFQGFVSELLEKAETLGDGELAGAVADVLTAKIAETGENLIIRRNVKFEVQGEGSVASYIHLGSKVGVLVEIGCEKAETTEQDAFKEVLKDVTLHIAASNPQYNQREEVPSDLVNAEKEIFAKQVEGKPAEIIGKIVTGKLEKFYSQICLPEQGFVKDPDQTVAQLLEKSGKGLGDTLSIRRFVRYQVGA